MQRRSFANADIYEPVARWIELHALAFDGFGWHARGFCQHDQVFRDWVLSRIIEVGELPEEIFHGISPNYTARSSKNSLLAKHSVPNRSLRKLGVQRA